jgi:hypothetical protein
MLHNSGTFMFIFNFSFSNLLVSLAFLMSKSRQQSQKHSRKYKIKIFFLKAQLAEMTLLVSQKEQERINLDEKREMLETILNDKDKTFRTMEGEIAGLKAQL